MHDKRMRTADSGVVLFPAFRGTSCDSFLSLKSRQGLTDLSRSCILVSVVSRHTRQVELWSEAYEKCFRHSSCSAIEAIQLVSDLRRYQMAHYQPRKFWRRGDNRSRIVMFNPPAVSYPGVHVVAAKNPWKTITSLLSWFL